MLPAPGGIVGRDEAFPRDENAHGLLALMLLHDSRRGTRLDEAGELALLSEQDRSRWDRSEIREGILILFT